MTEPLASPVKPSWMSAADLLPWSWAEERIAAERSYWVVTVRTDGFPQARPVWGVWSDGGLFLSVGGGGLPRTALTPAMPVTVHLDDAIDAVIIEGVIDRIHGYGPTEEHQPTFSVDDDQRRAVVAAYNEKYSWDFDPDTTHLNFLVRPRVVFGWHTTPNEVKGATKWVFE